jgi:hypothetical protein
MLHYETAMKNLVERCRPLDGERSHQLELEVHQFTRRQI